MATSPRRIDRASLRIPGPPERIYAAFIDASTLAKWLPPKGARGIIDAFEPHPGGAFRMTLVFDAATATGGKTTSNTDVVSGRFVELVPGERIVWAMDFESDDPAFAGTMTMTWTFAAENGSTLVTITAADVPPGIRPEDHEVGMTSSLANLAEHVARPT